MIVETELKLRITPESMGQLKRHPLLKSLAAARAVTHKVHNIYFDTPELYLRNHAMALRLRHIGRDWLQTLKGGGGVEAGLHSRNEWETPVAGEGIEFAALEAVGAKLPPAVRKTLRPVFLTDFSRNLRQLNFEGSAIELCMDSGEIRAGTTSRPISELELELKSGEPQQLFRLAAALLDIVPLEVEHISKAEYGYRLYRAEKPSVGKASFPRLEKSQGVTAALRSMVSACLLHVQANVPGAVQGLDEEYLHQVRVGLRRLRVVLVMAEAYRTDAELDALHEQVAKLCIDLGSAREWDVFVTQTLPPICARLPEHAGLREVLHAGEKIREQHNAAMRANLASQDFQRLLLRVGHWMHGAYWQEQPAEIAPNLGDFATQILEKRGKQASKRGAQLAQADPAKLHALRITCKKLRYSAEMFGSLFPAGKTSRYLAPLSGVQDILGWLNDIAVARRLLDEMDDGTRHETHALILGWLEHEYVARLAELSEAWQRFAGQKVFWD